MFSLEFVRFERRNGNAVRFLISFHQQELKRMSIPPLGEPYVPLLTLWGNWRMLAGFWAPFGPLLWYIDLRLIYNLVRDFDSWF